MGRGLGARASSSGVCPAGGWFLGAMGLYWPGMAFPGCGGPVGCVQSRELGARALPSEVYLPGKLLCHFTCGFDFVHSLLLPFEAALAVLKRLNGKKKNYSALIIVQHSGVPEI